MLFAAGPELSCVDSAQSRGEGKPLLGACQTPGKWGGGVACRPWSGGQMRSHCIWASPVAPVVGDRLTIGLCRCSQRTG